MAPPYTAALPIFIGGGAGPFTNAVPATLVDSLGNAISGTNPLGFSHVTNAAGTGTIDIAVGGAITATIPNSTSNAWAVKDQAGNTYWTTDTHTGADGITAHTIGNGNITIAAVAGTQFRQITNAPFTLTLTGGAAVTALNGLSAAFQAPTIANGTSLITTTSTLSIQGPPTVTGTAPTNLYALDVLSGMTHLNGNLGVGAAANAQEGITISSALTGTGTGQHGIFGTYTADGTQTNEVVLGKLTLTSVTANANVLPRLGGINIGGLAAGNGQTTTLTVAYSWDGGTFNTSATFNQINGIAIGNDGGNASVSITNNDFIGFKLNTWTITAVSGTVNFRGMLINPPTFSGTVAEAAGIRIGNIAGASNNYAIRTAQGSLFFGGLITTYNNVACAGNGLDQIVAFSYSGTRTNQQTTVTSFANPAADHTYLLSCSVNVTAAASASMSVTITYTDANNASQTQTFQLLKNGTTAFLTNGLIVATGDYISVPIEVRVKASTTITIITQGTVTGITYTIGGTIRQVA